MHIEALGISRGFMTYESNVVFALRFMIDCGVSGGNWVQLPAGSYQLVPPAQAITHCQLEAHVHFASIISHAAEGVGACMWKVRVLCMGNRTGRALPQVDHALP